MGIEKKKIKTWKNEAGNLCFMYKMREPLEKPWIIILLGIFFASIIICEFLIYNTWFTSFPLIILFAFSFIYWAGYALKFNEIINEEIVFRNVDLRIHNFFKESNNEVYEVKRKLYYEVKGTYGIVSHIYMLILLSDQKILVYDLNYHKATETNKGYFEFVKKPQIKDDLKFVKVINKKGVIQRYNDWKISPQTKLLLLLYSLIAIGTLITAGLIFLVIYIGKYILWYLIGFMVLWLISRFFLNSNNKLVNFFSKIISFPFLLVGVLNYFMFPIITILISYFFLGVITIGIPFIIIRTIDLCFGINLSLSTILFLVLSIGAIVSVYGSKAVHWIIKNYSPIKDWGNHEYEKLSNELALYVIHQKNINYLIYLAYFIFLITSGFMQMQYELPLITSNIDTAILKSFLVFIAYSNVIAKSKEVDIDSKELLKKIIKLITR